MEKVNFPLSSCFNGVVKVAEKDIVQAYLSLFPTCHSHKQCVALTAGKTGVDLVRVREVVYDAGLKEEAFKFKEELREVLLRDKLPDIDRIQELSTGIVIDRLTHIASSAEEKAKLTVADIDKLSNIALRMEDLMRLNQGKSTSQSPVYASYNQSVTMIKELKTASAIIDLPDVEVVNDKPDSQQS